MAVVELMLGFWTLLFPRTFYYDVPTIDLTPPYSEHLLRDFGGATLGLAVVLGAAAIWLERRSSTSVTCTGRPAWKPWYWSVCSRRRWRCRCC
jgi:hypothetical protein